MSEKALASFSRVSGTGEEDTVDFEIVLPNGVVRVRLTMTGFADLMTGGFKIPCKIIRNTPNEH